MHALHTGFSSGSTYTDGLNQINLLVSHTDYLRWMVWCLEQLPHHDYCNEAGTIQTTDSQVASTRR